MLLLILNLCAYTALLLIPFSIGLIVGTDKNISKKDECKFSLISSLILGLFSFAGIGVAWLFHANLSYMGAILVLVAGLTTFSKGGKSNAFLFSIDTLSVKRYVYANIGIGLSVFLATFGLQLFGDIPFYLPIFFLALSFLICFLGIKYGEKIKALKTIKIFLILSGIFLFLVGLVMFVLVWV